MMLGVTRPCAHEHQPLGVSLDGVECHHHDHDAPHEHRPISQQRLRTALVITAAMMLFEIVGAIATGSLALLSDAVHMGSHTLALAVSFIAIRIAGRPASGMYPFGYYRMEVLAAFVNGLTLVAFAIGITWAAVARIAEPSDVLGAEMAAIAVLGLIVNLAAAWILHGVRDDGLNTRSAFLHVLADTVSSVAVVIGGAAIWVTGWSLIDPIVSAGIAVLIARWSWGLLRDSGHILLERIPDELDFGALTAALRELGHGIIDVRDVRVRAITNGFLVATARVVVAEDTMLSDAEGVRRLASALLRERFGIVHTTIELEVCRGKGGS